MKVKPLNFVLFFYFFIAYIFLYIYGFEALDANNSIQFFADSPTYEKIYKEQLYKELGFFSVGSNYLGPVLILELTNGNRSLVFLINCTILYISFFLLKNKININNNIFFFFLLLNPLTFQSLLSVNKEIFSVIVAILFFLWVDSRRWSYLIYSIILSILVRWQLTILLILLVPTIIFFNSTYFSRVVVSVLFVFFLSLVFKFLMGLGFFDSVVTNFVDSAHLHDGGGFFVFLNQLQMDGFYFIVWVLKFLQISFALSFNVLNVFNYTDFQNDVVMVFTSITYLLIFLYALKLKVFSFRNKFFVLLIFSISFMSLSLIFSPRYFYFIFVIIMLMVSLRKGCRFV